LNLLENVPHPLLVAPNSSQQTHNSPIAKEMIENDANERNSCPFMVAWIPVCWIHVRISGHDVSDKETIQI